MTHTYITMNPPQYNSILINKSIILYYIMLHYIQGKEERDEFALILARAGRLVNARAKTNPFFHLSLKQVLNLV